MELKKGFVQIHPADLAALIVMAKDHVRSSEFVKSEKEALNKKLVKITRSFRQANGRVIPEMKIENSPFSSAEYNRKIKRRNESFYHRVNQTITFMWNGYERTGKILGRAGGGKKNFAIAVLMEAGKYNPNHKEEKVIVPCVVIQD